MAHNGVTAAGQTKARGQARGYPWNIRLGSINQGRNSLIGFPGTLLKYCIIVLLQPYTSCHCIYSSDLFSST